MDDVDTADEQETDAKLVRGALVDAALACALAPVLLAAVAGMFLAAAGLFGWVCVSAAAVSKKGSTGAPAARSFPGATIELRTDTAATTPAQPNGVAVNASKNGLSSAAQTARKTTARVPEAAGPAYATRMHAERDL